MSGPMKVARQRRDHAWQLKNVREQLAKARARVVDLESQEAEIVADAEAKAAEMLRQVRGE